jgi:cyclopropane fatty-acyl-phospholipid synthase-like methyltransferase
MQKQSRCDVEALFRTSEVGWFRARTYHEHGIISRYVRNRIVLPTARILDFGCGGMPLAAASFALRYPDAEVVGTDVELPDHARVSEILQREVGLGPPRNLLLHHLKPSTLPASLGQFELIYAWSVFEHIPASEIRACFALIRERLSPSGVFFFQIGGLYHSQFGSHLGLYLGKSWKHLELSLSEIYERIQASDVPVQRKEREWRQFLELNRLTSRDFLSEAASAGLKLSWKDEICEGDPPPKLLNAFAREALTTSEIRAIFTR